MKFDEKGEFLYTATDNLQNVFVYKFNNQTGKLTFHEEIEVIEGPTYGVEIKDNKLYASISGLDYYLISWDLEAVDINTSKKIIAYSTFDIYTQLQRALDNKVYIGLVFDKKLGIIENINGKDTLTFTDTLFQNRRTYNGFPNFNASFFHTPALNFRYKYKCHSHTSDFTAIDTFGANSFTWNFSKGSLKGTKTGKELNYTFLDTGRWNVQLIASNGSRTDTTKKVIEIFSINRPSFLGKDIHHTFNAPVSGTLDAPNNQHCSHWWKLGDTTEQLESSYSYTDTGTYICKTTNKHFCHRWDTIQVKVCDTGFLAINRIKDTLFPSAVLDSNIWYKGGIRLGEAPRLILSSQGNYTLVQTNEFGCKDTAKFDVNFLYAGLKDISTSNFRIYPNPNNGEFTIKGIESNANIKILDALGKEIGFKREKQTITLKYSSTGMYYIVIDGEATKLFVE